MCMVLIVIIWTFLFEIWGRLRPMFFHCAERPSTAQYGGVLDSDSEYYGGDVVIFRPNKTIKK